MIFGIGVDTIEIKRMENLIKRHSDKILNRLFTKNEIRYCTIKRTAESFAARFAAKEALLKATGIGLNKGFRWIDFEILNDELGKPHVYLYGRAEEFFRDCKIFISLTHTKIDATAFVVVEKTEGGSE